MAGIYTTDDSWMDGVDFSNVEQRIAAIDKQCVNTFNGMLGIRFPYLSTEKVVAELDISPKFYQPFGFLHGGVTLALIESAASRAADMRTDFSKSAHLVYILKLITKSQVSRECCALQLHLIVRKRISKFGM